jgi:hypothetical protein
VFVNPSAMPSGQTLLPEKMNRGSWAHPVFGNRAVWARQTSRPRWFDDAVAGREGDFERAITTAMEKTAAQIEGGA